ncbi:MAG TPA: FAD-dependent thymidylate synthase [Bryobacteraceae bacterium]|nr:FAD-dependent thymidylate synthase [Bryobacteraceae bacterium]
MTTATNPRVLAVAPMPPEKVAYALARYSRSPDSIRDSVAWVRTHDSMKFLESFYFQYGHASIADLGHVVLCFEGISELAATEAEDEQLWDGQARSSRYQDFSRSGFVTPPELNEGDAAAYTGAGETLLAAYHQIHQRMCEFLAERLPRPTDMKPEAYQRNIAARAFDVARYTLFFGIPTGVGQVTSIRTLEHQIRRLKSSEYAEVRELASEIAEACARPPVCVWDENAAAEPVAPTLARHVDPDQHAAQSRRDLEIWARQNLPAAAPEAAEMVDLIRPSDTHAEIAATLLYPVTNYSFRALYEMTTGWSAARRNEVIEIALRSRTGHDDLLRGFRGGPYAYDIVMDIGAYRDLHRHRRCQQYRQAYNGRLGFDTPQSLIEAGLQASYEGMMNETFAAMARLPEPASHYLLPFGARSRFLFKMDFAEAEYIAKLRSGVKGHFSYRQVAWEMKQKMERLEPELGRLMEATPPWVEDPLKR